MKFAYADPPYPGQAKRHYKDEAERDGRVAREVNHQVLIETLCVEYPDGWALSTSSGSLRDLLPMCPEDIRVAAWCKPFAAWRANVVPPYAWEPVLFRTTRARSLRGKTQVASMKPCDWIVEMPPVFVGKGNGVHGAKPDRFVWWILDLLGYEQGDTFDDLFPGSGNVTKALEQYRRAPRLFNGGEQIEAPL